MQNCHPTLEMSQKWPEILEVAEFARIQATGNCPNSGEFAYLASCQEILLHPKATAAAKPDVAYVEPFGADTPGVDVACEIRRESAWRPPCRYGACVIPLAA